MHDHDPDVWESFELQFDPLYNDRHARRARKPRHVVKHSPPRSAILAELGEAVGDEAGFATSYHPSRYEEGWLLEALRPFFLDGLIVDVLARVRGGKEAAVYCCAAHPRTGMDLLAAKVYRPHQLRTLRNDAIYREGRDVLAADGQPVKETDDRVMRALGKKTEFGRQVAHTSWLMHEYGAMRRLVEAGGAAPRPVAAADDAILMAYWGDAGRPAPQLADITLEPPEARRLVSEVLRNVRLLLGLGVVHGDLSAYNILYWRGRIGLIDFPQVVSVETNRQARRILERDVLRVCQYFQAQGVDCDAQALADDLWLSAGAGERDLAAIVVEYPRT